VGFSLTEKGSGAGMGGIGGEISAGVTRLKIETTQPFWRASEKREEAQVCVCPFERHRQQKSENFGASSKFRNMRATPRMASAFGKKRKEESGQIGWHEEMRSPRHSH